jgi:hypothetical protein
MWPLLALAMVWFIRTTPPARADSEPSCGLRPPAVLFLNFDPVHLDHRSDCSDAPKNCSFLVPKGGLDLPGYTGATAARAEIARRVAAFFAPYNVAVVTRRPTSGSYEMSVIGGTPVGLGAKGLLGVGPKDCGNNNPNDISFAFAQSSQNDPHTVAVTVAQEAAHGFGLGHVNDPEDIMYPTSSQRATGFHDKTSKIFDKEMQDLDGNVVTASSDCSGRGMQNDVQLLTANLGPACAGIRPGCVDGTDCMGPSDGPGTRGEHIGGNCAALPLGADERLPLEWIALVMMAWAIGARWQSARRRA